MAREHRLLVAGVLLLCASGRLALPRYGLFERAYGASNQVLSTTVPTTSPTAGFPTSNKGCFPNIINNTVPSDFRNKVAKFYEYRSKSVPQQVYNAFFTNALVGDAVVYLPGTTTLAIHASEIYEQITMSDDGKPVCDNQNLDFLSRLDGVDLVQIFDDVYVPTVPLYSVSYYLYNDDFGPNGFEIVYACNKLNTASGMCDDPNVYVNVRTHPNSLSAADKSRIDDITDKTLKPYCMSKADLQVTIFRADLAACNQPPRQDFLNLMAGYNASLARPLQA